MTVAPNSTSISASRSLSSTIRMNSDIALLAHLVKRTEAKEGREQRILATDWGKTMAF
jgi:hypothetical protein